MELSITCIFFTAPACPTGTPPPPLPGKDKYLIIYYILIKGLGGLTLDVLARQWSRLCCAFDCRSNKTHVGAGCVGCPTSCLVDVHCCSTVVAFEKRFLHNNIIVNCHGWNLFATQLMDVYPSLFNLFGKNMLMLDVLIWKFQELMVQSSSVAQKLLSLVAGVGVSRFVLFLPLSGSGPFCMICTLWSLCDNVPADDILEKHCVNFMVCLWLVVSFPVIWPIPDMAWILVLHCQKFGIEPISLIPDAEDGISPMGGEPQWWEASVF